jgi:hypothetical protein
MKLNRGGLILSGIYAAVSLALFALAYFYFINETSAQVLKGRVILLQLAGAPAMMLLTYTGLINPLMKACPWLNNFFAFFGMSLAIMYLIGWGFSNLGRIGAEKNPPN